MQFNSHQSPIGELIGNSATLWVVNFEVERFWSKNNPKNILGSSLGSDLGSLVYPEQNVLCVARPQDVVLLRETPCPHQIKYLQSLGLAKCSVHVLDIDSASWSLSLSQCLLNFPDKMQTLKNVLTEKQVKFLTPFGTTSFDEEVAKELGLQLWSASSDISQKVNSKLFSSWINDSADFPVIPNKPVYNIQDLKRVALEFLEKHEQILIKDPMGVSGKGIKKIASVVDLISYVQFLQNRNFQDFELLIEACVDKKEDLNTQIIVKRDGSISPIIVKSAITKDGKHLGHVSGIAQDREFENIIDRAGKHIGKSLHENGFYGVAGYDGIKTSNGALFPNIEINARLNQSSLQWTLDQGLGHSKYFWYGFIEVKKTPELSYQKILENLKSDYLFTSDRSTGFIPINSMSLHAKDNKANARVYGAYYFDSLDTLSADLSSIKTKIEGLHDITN